MAMEGLGHRVGRRKFGAEVAGFAGVAGVAGVAGLAGAAGFAGVAGLAGVAGWAFGGCAGFLDGCWATPKVGSAIAPANNHVVMRFHIASDTSYQSF
ncbi:MAG: hypothetical protein HZLCBSQH_000233 [Candidatus Fervidibacterota bacterium]